jgi:hypothetical protein
MYVTNTKQRGYLIDYDNVQASHLHNDLWQIFDNPYVSITLYLKAIF